MNFEIKGVNGDRFFIYKGKSGNFICEITDIFEAAAYIFTQDEAKELINYLKKENENEK